MLIEVKDVEACPELIPTVTLDENVDMYYIRKYLYIRCMAGYNGI